MSHTISKVHLVCKTHLDVGFTDFAQTVLDEYLYQYIPAAIAVAEELRARGGNERFVWTTGSWLIAEYLERASPAERERLETAIRAGDIVWHGLPFTTHTELIDPSLMRFGLRIAADLDRRFGRTTIAAKMTDVPGHTRGLVPLLATSGIVFLHIGVNEASTPPDVPPVFVWRDPSGAEVIVMYQKGGYGDLVLVPGLDEALAFAHTNDNHGPQTIDQVVANYAALQQRLPGAQIVASTMDAFARRLVAVKAQLPVVTAEIGDTWIHGAGSDPLKVAQFRALSRLRQRWLAAGHAAEDDEVLQRFSRLLLLVPEHTWGMDEKTHLADYTAYNGTAFRDALQTERFRRFAASWDEQRGYLRAAVATLGESPLATEAHETLRALEAVRPNIAGFDELKDQPFHCETPHFVLHIDLPNGAITTLTHKASGRTWATTEQPLALIGYQSFDATDYERFYERYNINKEATAHWSVDDYTKPGIDIAGARSGWWRPTISHVWQRHDADGLGIVVELDGGAEAVESLGCPRRFTMELWLPNDAAEVHLTLQWFGKTATRLPEALWLSFVPPTQGDGAWTLAKLGEAIDPRDVVSGGNRTLHGVADDVAYRDTTGSLTITTLDAPLVAPGRPALVDFPNTLPNTTDGVHFNLYNNVWGTNFPMWYDDDGRFRFVIAVA